MMRHCHVLMLLISLLLSAETCLAGGVKVYVNRFSVSTSENRDELKKSLQTLLMSRLNSDMIQAVENQSEAQIQVDGSYIVFGNVFSLDALLKTTAGVFIDRVFIQGDSQNELIPAVTEMARSLQIALGKWDSSLAVPDIPEKAGKSADVKPVAEVNTATPPVQKPVESAMVKTAQVQNQRKIDEPSWESHRLPEALNGIAIGRSISGKGVEVFITGDRYLRYYMKGNKLQFLDAEVVDSDEQIVGVDVADLDRNGVPEIYVSVIKRGIPASRVYVPEESHLNRVAADLPFMLRGISSGGSELKIYAQRVAESGVLEGDVFELVKNDKGFSLGRALRLPMFANLYNFCFIGGSTGEKGFVVSHPDGYLLRYSSDNTLLWKSRDKFGGSEAVLYKAGAGVDAQEQAFSLYQRMFVTRGGDLIVPRNLGMIDQSGKRSYTKNRLLLLSANGKPLQEISRSGLSPNYLADFAYDGRTNELLLLEVEPGADSNGEWGSRVVVRTIE